MNEKQAGPYKHYQRPTVPRTMTYRSVSRKWVIIEVLIIVVLVALVPVVHYLASSAKGGHQVVEVQKTVKRQKAASKTSVKEPKPKPKTEVKTKLEPKTKTKPKTEHVKKTRIKRKAPKVAAAPEQYLVKTGDSLTGIANKYHMSVGELAQLNDLTADSQVNVGQVLKLK